MSQGTKEPELLVDLAAKASALAKQLLGAPDDVAEAFGADLAQVMASDWGGQSIYFPLGTCYKVARLHQEVWDAFKGDNINELASKFHISRVWVYKIVGRMREAELARRQAQLFTGPDPTT